MVDADAIADLRRAAAGELGPDEWAGDALDRALADWEPAEMIALAESLLRSGLPTFERHQPGADWPRRALDGEVTELGPDYDGPGGNSFASGVEYLLDARASVHDPAACRRWVVDAITRAVMAERCAAWGAEYPERWRRWLESDGPLQPYDEITSRWYEHPSVLRVQRRMWNEVADRILARG